jgi:uncharacterized protein
MIKKLVIFLIVFLSISQIFGQDDTCNCYGPPPNRLVVDQVDILTDNEENILENKLRTLNAETSNQVIIVTLDELCAGDAAMTATEIGHCWGVGQKEFDNGAVILVKPTGGQGQRRTFIAIGYGLEGAIPDATAKLIVDNEMIPQFKNGNYFAGLDQAVTRISALASGEYSFADYNKKVEKKGAGLLGLLPILFFIGIWILLTYRRTSSYARNNDLGFWAALMLMNASRRSHSGSWNSFSSGSGSFGGGGGFGGFGGGGVGGGGAGGSW